MTCDLCGEEISPINAIRITSIFERYDHFSEKWFCNWPCVRKYSERQTTNVADLENAVGIFDPAYIAEMEEKDARVGSLEDQGFPYGGGYGA